MTRRKFSLFRLWNTHSFFAFVRNCGVPNPTWSELRNFVNFLNNQLSDCEESAFCDPSLTADTLQGLKTFVVKFMIIMSEVRKVFKRQI